MAGLNASALLDTLKQGPRPSCYFVGYSGGLDSTVLLHALYTLREELVAGLEAIHFNHGVHPRSDDWQAHCEAFCQKLGIPLHVVALQMDSLQAFNFEERARELRYTHISEMIAENDVYLTAHHRDDQAETLLMNLARGAGLQGMSGIPQLRRLGSAWVMRPLLDSGREDLRQYAHAKRLEWCEDTSNQDVSHDRNFVRHAVMPLLDQRWPGTAERLAKSAYHARNAADLLGQFIEAREDVNLDQPVTLPLRVLGDPEQAEAAVLLRHWLRKHEAPQLPASQLNELLRQLANTGGAEVRWANWVLRRFRDQLWLHQDQSIGECPEIRWSQQELELGAPWGALKLKDATSVPGKLTVRSRRKGERFRSANGAPSRSFKNMFQQSAVPPWLRSAVPVTCLDDEPAAIGDWIICSPLQKWLENEQARLIWSPGHAALKRVRQLAHAAMVDQSDEVG